jgi:hypothetical protein
VPVLLLLPDPLVGATVRFAISSIGRGSCFGYSGSLVARGAAAIFDAAGRTTLAGVVARVFFVRWALAGVLKVWYVFCVRERLEITCWLNS